MLKELKLASFEKNKTVESRIMKNNVFADQKLNTLRVQVRRREDLRTKSEAKL